MDDYIVKLNKRLDQLKESSKFVELDFKEIIRMDSADFRTVEKINKLSVQFNGYKNPIVYRFYLDSKEHVDHLRLSLAEFQNSQNELKSHGDQKCNTTRSNAGEVGATNTIYVGSSKKFKTRFKEHLGHVSYSTYAIKLNKWDKDIKIYLES